MLSASSSPGPLPPTSPAASAGLLPFAGTSSTTASGNPPASFASLLDGETAPEGEDGGTSDLAQGRKESADEPAVLPAFGSGHAVRLTEADPIESAGDDEHTDALPSIANEEETDEASDAIADESAFPLLTWTWHSAPVGHDPVDTEAGVAGEADAEPESGAEDVLEGETEVSRTEATPGETGRRSRSLEADVVIAGRGEPRPQASTMAEKPAFTEAQARLEDGLDNRGLARAAEVASASEHSAVARYREQQAAAEGDTGSREWPPRSPESRDAWRSNAASFGLERSVAARFGLSGSPAVVSDSATSSPGELEFELPDVAVEPVLPPARIAGSDEPEAPEAVRMVMAELQKLTQRLTQEVVNPTLHSLGIDPAKVSSTMEFVSPERSPLGPEMQSGQPGSAYAAGASRTVEQVLHTADLMRAADRSGVQLRLDFGESGPLSVQITLRQGRVHTLFRSDSPELRTTLAQAWDRFAQRGDISVLPLAEPVVLPLRTNLSSAMGEGGRFSGSFAQADSDSRSGRESREAREDTSRSGAPVSRRRSSRPVTSSPARESAPGHLRVHA